MKFESHIQTNTIDQARRNASRPKAVTTAAPDAAPPAKRPRLHTNADTAKATVIAVPDTPPTIRTPGVDRMHNAKPGPDTPGAQFLPLRTPGDCVLVRGRTWHMSWELYWNESTHTCPRSWDMRGSLYKNESTHTYPRSWDMCWVLY